MASCWRNCGRVRSATTRAAIEKIVVAAKADSSAVVPVSPFDSMSWMLPHPPVAVFGGEFWLRSIFTTSPEWIEKKMPCESFGRNVLTPMTRPQPSNSGPPLLPGLMAALCCTVNALTFMSLLLAITTRETEPVVMVGSSVRGSMPLPRPATMSALPGKPTAYTSDSFSGSYSASVKGAPGRTASASISAKSCCAVL